jgi:hypothetical protein
MNPPAGTKNHKIVLNYVGAPVLYFELQEGVTYTRKLQEELKKYKIAYLEDKLGYKLEKLEDMISHEVYEKQMTAVIPADFVDEKVDPQKYVDRYNKESIFRRWFAANYPQYKSIEQAVGLLEDDSKK